MKKLVCALCFVVCAGFSEAQISLILRLAPGVVPASIAIQYGIRLKDYTVGAPFALYTLPVGMDSVGLRTQMAGNTGIVWAEDNGVAVMPEHAGGGKGGSIAAIGDRNALYGYNQSLLRQISWDVTRANSTGRSVRIAILDDGVSLKQPAIWARVVASINYCEPGQVATDWPRHQDSNANGLFDEALGHGTMVAGIINQLAPQCGLIIARVADSDGNATAWNVIKGIAFAVTNGAEVANISLGSVDTITALSDVLDWATEEKNLLVVAAIGNNSAELMLSPSSSGKVAAVSGLDPTNHKALFSNWDRGAIVSAPATGVKSFWWTGGVGVWSGTSFASPMVAAAVGDALRRRSGPARARRLRDKIESSGDTLVRTLNPAYSDSLGLRLNCRRLNDQVVALPPFP